MAEKINPNPMSRMRQLDAQGKAYVLNDIIMTDFSISAEHGVEVLGYDDTWIAVKHDDKVIRIRWWAIIAINLVEL
jgi:hypothetical protein